MKRSRIAKPRCFRRGRGRDENYRFRLARFITANEISLGFELGDVEGNTAPRNLDIIVISYTLFVSAGPAGDNDGLGKALGIYRRSGKINDALFNTFRLTPRNSKQICIYSITIHTILKNIDSLPDLVFPSSFLLITLLCLSLYLSNTVT